MLYDIAKKKKVVEKVIIADSFLKRFLGLMGKRELEEGRGMMLLPCSSIHTCFMRFPIDVVFLDQNHKVIYMIQSMKPWRCSKVVKNSMYVIELQGGIVARQGIELGDQLVLQS
jgi:uncharacterized membrane protein (UPF0127 family)